MSSRGLLPVVFLVCPQRPKRQSKGFQNAPLRAAHLPKIMDRSKSEAEIRNDVPLDAIGARLRVRNISLDWLKIFLAIAVIGIHTFSLWQGVSAPLYMLKNGVFRIAVPTFLIINGFYIFSIIEQPVRFKRWCVRLILLYVIWTCVYASHFLPQGFSMETIIKLSFTIFFGYFHLWYLIAALFGGLILRCVRNLRDRTLALIIASLLVIGTAFQYWMRYSDFWALMHVGLFDLDSLYRNFLFVAFPYLGVGYLIAKNRIVAKAKIFPLALVFAAGLICVQAEALFNYNRVGSVKPFDMLIGLPFCVISIFVLCQKLYISGSAKWIAHLPQTLYLVHPLILLAAINHGVPFGLPLFGLTVTLSFLVAPLILKIARRYPQIV